MIKGKRREILSAIASSPRKATAFTHGIHKTIHPDTLQLYLDEMQEHGYIIENDGQYSITTLGRQKLDAVPVMAAPRTFVSRERYVPPPMESARPGADDHKQFFSKGF